MRNGPGLNQLILFKILAKGYPLEIKEEYENWYKVIDYKKGLDGYQKQLSKTRYGILIMNNQKLFKFPNLNSKQLAIVKSDYILRILKCRKTWCKVEDKKLRGWMLKKSLWGFVSD